MAIVLALPRLFDLVKAYVQLRAPTCACEFGWREPAKWNAGADGKRIVFMPGDLSGKLGKELPARQPGRLPRPLATLGELFTVYISAYDSTGPRDERKQYQAARELYDLFRSAMHAAAYGTVTVEDPAWNRSKTEHQSGAEIVVVCAVEAMVPDAADVDTEETTTGAEITAHAEDVTTVTTIAAPE